MIICDAHVHLHPGHSLADALRALAVQLNRLACAAGAPDAACLALLAERAGTHMFEAACRGELNAAPFSLHPASDGSAVEVRMQDGRSALWLIPGRQVVTSERLEVLVATVDAEIPDGLPVGDTLAAARAAGGVPGLPWGVGKWLGNRGQIVRELIDANIPGRLWLCDSGLRPYGWPTPALLSLARRRGLTVLAGTDVLPRPGDWRFGGRYAALCPASFDSAAPAASARRIFTFNPTNDLHLLGARACPWTFLARWRP
ncbi:MAG: hypothetical protein WCL16_01365 [bacterium]